MKTLLCSAFLIFSTFCFSQKIDSTIVIGTWQSELDEDNTFGSFIFDKDGFITIESQGITMGGANGMAKGKPIQMIYKLDVSKKPMQLDILVRKPETKTEMIAMKAIVEFSSDLKMKIAIDQEQRPTEFTSENSMSFSRIK
jgi:uncharacterized protein (TIGR03067 family)